MRFFINLSVGLKLALSALLPLLLLARQGWRAHERMGEVLLLDTAQRATARADDTLRQALTEAVRADVLSMAATTAQTAAPAAPSRSSGCTGAAPPAARCPPGCGRMSRSFWRRATASLPPPRNWWAWSRRRRRCARRRWCRRDAMEAALECVSALMSAEAGRGGGGIRAALAALRDEALVVALLVVLALLLSGWATTRAVGAPLRRLSAAWCG